MSLQVDIDTRAILSRSEKCNLFKSVRSSEKFLSFYEEIIDARRFLYYITLCCITYYYILLHITYYYIMLYTLCFVLYYIILLNRWDKLLNCWDKHRDISQTRFHVCMKMHRCKKRVCGRKILFNDLILVYLINVNLYLTNITITDSQAIRLVPGKLWNTWFRSYN